MTKVSFFTLGCRVNQAETAVLEDVFRQKGFRLVEGCSPADIAVINSCTVTDEGDHEASRIMNRVRKSNPDVRIALIGCQAQVQKDKVLAMPNVRWAVGTARKMDLADIILDDRDQLCGLFVAPPRRQAFTMPAVASVGRRIRANLKVQDGCDNFCAYCEVPFARGRARSRVFDDVMRAAEVLVRAGHQEIVLTGINIGLYAHEGKGLVDLIKALEAFEGLRRIRLSSIEYAPWIGELARFMKPPHKLCRFLHVPVQSGCDRILGRMGRKYACRDVAQALEALTASVPGLMIGTDVITGFPGETDRDFEQTVEFLTGEPFHYFHVFSYADRSRARSRSFQGAVPGDMIRRRARRLRELGRSKQQAFLQACLGSTEEVLLEQKKENDWIGHTDNYVTIKTSSDRGLRGQIIPVKLVRVEGGSVRGVRV